jgi:hypothetical protein
VPKGLGHFVWSVLIHFGIQLNWSEDVFVTRETALSADQPFSIKRSYVSVNNEQESTWKESVMTHF